MKLTYEQLEQTIASDAKRRKELEAKLDHLRKIIQSDATAISYQTMSGYRDMILKEIDK